MYDKVDFFHLDSEDAQFIAVGLRKRLGISCKELVLGEYLDMDPHRPFVIYNGNGYQHQHTRRILQDLHGKRSRSGLPLFSYVHIDGHDDMASMYDGDNDSYKSFVVGVLEDKTVDGVFFLEEGLARRRRDKPHFFTPEIGPDLLDWGGPVESPKHNLVYVSVDFDVLDEGAGINHLFPHARKEFNMARLLWNIEELGESCRFVGTDFVGFSRQGASKDYVETSLDNIARVTEITVNALKMC